MSSPPALVFFFRRRRRISRANAFWRGLNALGSRLLRSSIDQPHAAVRDLDRKGRLLCRSVQFPPATWETVLTGPQSSQRNVRNSTSGWVGWGSIAAREVCLPQMWHGSGTISLIRIWSPSAPVQGVKAMAARCSVKLRLNPAALYGGTIHWSVRLRLTNSESNHGQADDADASAALHPLNVRFGSFDISGTCIDVRKEPESGHWTELREARRGVSKSTFPAMECWSPCSLK